MLVTVAVKGGEGKHMNELTPDEMEWLFKVRATAANSPKSNEFTVR